MSEEKINFVHCNIDNNFDKWQAWILKELESRIKTLESSRGILSTFVDDNTRNFTKQHCDIVDFKKQITELKKDFDDLVNKLQKTFVGIDIASGKDKTVFSVIHPDTREPGLYVKSKDEIVKWLKSNGYIEYITGYVHREIDNCGFSNKMFDYCGKKINSNSTEGEGNYFDYGFFWLPEWLEEVPGKSGENIQPTDVSREILNLKEAKKILNKIKKYCSDRLDCTFCFLKNICDVNFKNDPENWDI